MNQAFKLHELLRNIIYVDIPFPNWYNELKRLYYYYHAIIYKNKYDITMNLKFKNIAEATKDLVLEINNMDVIDSVFNILRDEYSIYLDYVFHNSRPSTLDKKLNNYLYEATIPIKSIFKIYKSHKF